MATLIEEEVRQDPRVARIVSFDTASRVAQGINETRVKAINERKFENVGYSQFTHPESMSSRRFRVPLVLEDLAHNVTRNARYIWESVFRSEL